MRNCSEKAPSVSKSNDEGCEDDKPLSARVKVQMSSTVQIKISVFASSSKKRPLVDNIKRNGSKPKGQSSQSPSKRHLEKGSSSNQSFVKRPKLLGNAATPDIKGKNLDACKPLKVNQATVREENSDGDDHLPIASRMRSGYSNNKSSSSKTNASKMIASSSRKIAKNICVKDSKALPFRDGQKKWTTLVHNGVLFPPPYKCHGVKILYQGKPVDLTPEQEEVATMFAKMRETEYYNKPLFRENFWNDWRELLGKNHVIRNLDDCDFSPIYEWYMQDIEIRKQMSAEEKRILKEEKLNQEEKYMWAVLDGVKEKAVNFRVEPPGLFRARGDHPKMGKLKKRIRPCDITINIGKDAPIPECPTPGERWKEIKHDTTVTWLAFWNDPINPKVFNYAFLAASSALKRLREACTKDLSDKDATKRETEVATYLIDKLSLRAGDEKVTIISDHDQRTVSESNGPQAERLAVKIEELREKIEELDIDLDGTEKETPAAEWTSDFFIVEPSVRRLEREKPPEHRRETKEIDIGFPLQSLQSLEEENECVEDSDDDKPIGFKRTSGVVSNSNQSKSNTQRSNAVSPLKSPVTTPNGTTPSNKTSAMTSSSKASPAKSSLQNEEDSDDDKPIVFKRTSVASNSKSNTQKNNAVTSTKVLPLKSPVTSPNASSKQVSSPQPEKKNTSGRPLGGANRVVKDESDDEKPISSVFQKKTGSSGMSGSKKVSGDEKKPLTKKLHQNGSAVKSEVPDCKVSGKRPLEKNHPANESSLKKPKVSASSTSGKMKQESVKTESSADKGRVLVSPTAKRAKPVSTKEDGSDDDDDVPISKRLKSESSSSKVSAAKPKAVKGNPSSSAAKKKVTKVVSPPSRTRTVNKNSKKVTKDSKYSSSSKSSPSSSDGQTKWTTLEHNGVIFPPPYKPHGIKILYMGKPVDLTIEQEEVATMFAVMKETDYYTKPQFRENFWNDWRKLLGKKHVIQKLDDCDFTPIYEWHLREKEKKKQMSTEEKKALKEEKLKLEEKYMWAVVDGVKEKVGNFRVEPPGLFRGRGEHPKMGKLKKRIHPSDITMNIGKGVPVPECPIPGEKWKDVKHDNTVTWLAFWNDPINPKEFKYVFLAASSAMKGLSDKEKYEKARNLTNHIDSIRATYTKNFTSKDVAKKQIAVATYLIDKLALRAGNEKDDDEADTVGCCTLKVGNVECIPPNQIKFDFLGKDSIRYENTVVVEPLVYKAIGQFQAGKSKEDDLFDELDTSKLNAHLKELVPGLTAKVFRTYNASFTLDEQLNEKMGAGDVTQKVVVYQQANKKVAIICNHQRAVSKSHSAQIEKLDAKLKELQNGLGELRTNLKRAKEGKPPVEGSDGKKPRNLDPNAWEKKIAQQEVKIEKMKRDMQTKEDLKTVALGTSKINYLDPRITVAWCKHIHQVSTGEVFMGNGCRTKLQILVIAGGKEKLSELGQIGLFVWPSQHRADPNPDHTKEEEEEEDTHHLPSPRGSFHLNLLRSKDGIPNNKPNLRGRWDNCFSASLYLGHYCDCLLLDDVGDCIHCADESSDCPNPKRNRVK
ncbi:hypothetical protein IGI04_005543 [Brassica rapa subsp. trilocularis]|uniref:DNA topoisomerase I n=1 Tax=Brassica rapa subsp. trilocularis TaxID=1813537 RepID=A0ABQ7NEB5_BRACM|nr:hypothetical protein IGI04_005543 [Brassica rapa subsp. trilocularis]